MTAKCRHIQETLLRDYRENGLPAPDHEAVTEHLSACDACAREEEQMTAMLAVLHTALPRHEPKLDLWAEFAPKMAEVRAEERLGVLARLRLRADRFWGNVALGAILFTQAVALNTTARFHKYLLVDPFLVPAEENF